MTLINPQPGGYPDGSTLPSDHMDQITQQLVKALDGQGGGAYTLASPLSLSGSPIRHSVAPVGSTDLANKAYVDAKVAEPEQRRNPAVIGTLSRDVSGDYSIDYEPEIGAFMMTTASSGLKWTQNGVHTWTIGSSLPGTPGGSESGRQVKGGAGCVLLGHGTASDSTQRLWRSTNGGSSWSSVTLPTSSVRPRFFRTGYSSWLVENFLPASSGATAPFYRSTNGGASFDTGTDLYFETGFSGIRYLARSPLTGALVAGVEGTDGVVRKVFYSSNEGASWTPVLLPGVIGNIQVKSLGWTPALGFFAACDVSGAPWLYSSTSGTSWIDAMGPIRAQHGASWSGFKSVVSCGNLLLGTCDQTTPTATMQLWSIAGVGAPWFTRGAIGLSSPLMVQEAWPVFGGATFQRPMPFILAQTAAGSDISVIV